MKQFVTFLLLLLSLAVQGQERKISYIETTKNWYYLYDEQGRQMGGLSRSSTGELQGWGSDYFVTRRYSYYMICDVKGRTLKSLNMQDVGEILSVSDKTFTSRKGSWLFTWSKDGKKLSVRNAH